MGAEVAPVGTKSSGSAARLGTDFAGAPGNRLAYLRALQDAQAGRGTAAFDRLLYKRLDATLREDLNAARHALAATKPKSERDASQSSPNWPRLGNPAL